MKKLFSLLAIALFLGFGTSCVDPCDELESALNSLHETIDATPNLKNPALYIHYDKACAAIEAEDMDGAIKNLNKFMNIGSQKKYTEIFDLFLDVENWFYKCKFE